MSGRRIGVVAADPVVAGLLHELVDAKLSIWPDLDATEPDLVVVVDINRLALEANPFSYSALANWVDNGVPCLFFAGWNSFGAGDWQHTPLEPRLPVRLERSDAVQRHLVVRGSDAGVRRGLPVHDLQSSAGYNAVAVERGDCLAWGTLDDGQRVPAIVVDGETAAVLFYAFPSGGRRVAFSRGLPDLLTWLFSEVSGSHVAIRARPSAVRSLIEKHWDDTLVEQDVASVAISRSGERSGRNAKLRMLQELCALHGFWSLAADLSAELGRHQTDDALALRSTARKELYLAMVNQERGDWRSVAQSYLRTAELWQRVLELDDACALTASRFPAFFRSVGAQANYLAEVLAPGAADALSALASMPPPSEVLGNGQHGLANALAPTLQAIHRLAASLREMSTSRRYRVLERVKAYRRLRRDFARSSSDLAASLNALEMHYPELRRSATLRDRLWQLSRLDRERVLSRFSDGFGDIDTASAVVPTSCLLLMLISAAQIIRPVRHRAMQGLTWGGTALIVAVIGLFSLPTAIVGAVLALAAWIYTRWMRGD